MKLKFYAKDDALATVPGFRAGIGQAMSYIGRTFQSSGQYPATRDPFEVDTATIPVSEAHRYLDHARRGHVWCADEATAAACGAVFVQVEYKDGVWSRKLFKETK